MPKTYSSLYYMQFPLNPVIVSARLGNLIQ